MINPLAFYSALGALAVGLFAGWSARDWKADADALSAYERADKIREDMQAKVDAASSGFADWSVGADARQNTARDTIREIYRDVEVPAECAVPDDARRVLEDSIVAANAAASGQPAGAVPAPADAPGSVARPEAGGVGD